MKLFAVALLSIISVSGPTDVPFPDAPLKHVIKETRQSVTSGVDYTYRMTADPMEIHVLEIDLSNPSVSVKTELSNGTVIGTETVSSMVKRTGAIAGVNGDYWSPNGIEQGLTIVDGKVQTAPKHRTALGITKSGKAVIDIWSAGWIWDAKVRAMNGNSHQIFLLNAECNPDWMCLYTDRFGRKSFGNELEDSAEVVLNKNKAVMEVRDNQPGVEIPKDGWLLTGRGKARRWILDNIKTGDLLQLDLKTTKPISGLQQAISAGPRILKNGSFLQDPISEFPAGEEFTLAWKRMHYLERQPRTAAGVSSDGKKLVLIVVDGRQPEKSIGIHQKQIADLLVEFGATEGMDLDSGGSSTMVINGRIVNRPSDGSDKNGDGGRERKVANGLLIFKK